MTFIPIHNKNYLMTFLIERMFAWCKFAICACFVIFALLLAQRPAPVEQKAVPVKQRVVQQVDEKVAEKVPASSTEKVENGTEAQTNFYSDPFDARTSLEGNSSFSYLLIRMMLVMAIIIAAAFFLLRYLKKRQGAIVGDQTLIRTIVEHPISMQTRVQIVKIVQDYFMLITTSDSAPYVRKIEDKASIDEIKIVENQKTASNPTFFKDLLTMRYQGTDQSYLKLPRALSVTKMMSEKMKKKQNWNR